MAKSPLFLESIANHKIKPLINKQHPMMALLTPKYSAEYIYMQLNLLVIYNGDKVEITTEIKEKNKIVY
jgi:hypothetical protein